MLLDYTQSSMSTYTADCSGVASALYELGGMTVIHDASGCNSTYTTHDEPRWNTMPSAVFISALTEMDAVLGNDSRIIDDIVDAARKLTPAFVAIAGTPIPMMTGVDLKGIARLVESRTRIPSFAVQTNSMRAYSVGCAPGLDRTLAPLRRSQRRPARGPSASTFWARRLSTSRQAACSSPSGPPPHAQATRSTPAGRWATSSNPSPTPRPRASTSS